MTPLTRTTTTLETDPQTEDTAKRIEALKNTAIVTCGVGAGSLLTLFKEGVGGIAYQLQNACAELLQGAPEDGTSEMMHMMNGAEAEEVLSQEDQQAVATFNELLSEHPDKDSVLRNLYQLMFNGKVKGFVPAWFVDLVNSSRAVQERLVHPVLVEKHTEEYWIVCTTDDPEFCAVMVNVLESYLPNASPVPFFQMSKEQQNEHPLRDRYTYARDRFEFIEQSKADVYELINRLKKLAAYKKSGETQQLIEAMKQRNDPKIACVPCGCDSADNPRDLSEHGGLAVNVGVQSPSNAGRSTPPNANGHMITVNFQPGYSVTVNHQPGSSNNLHATTTVPTTSPHSGSLTLISEGGTNSEGVAISTTVIRR